MQYGLVGTHACQSEVKLHSKILHTKVYLQLKNVGTILNRDSPVFCNDAEKRSLHSLCVFGHLICTNFLDAQWCILMLLIDKTWSFWKLFILIWSTSLTLRWKSLSSLSIMLLESQSIQWLFVHVCRATADLSVSPYLQSLWCSYSLVIRGLPVSPM